MRRLSLTVLLALMLSASTCRLDPLVAFCGAGDVCDDGNPCTVDSCDEKADACIFEPLPNGSECGDNDVCNGVETCDENAMCQAGTPIVVADGDPCTQDLCDPLTGEVTNPPIDGCRVPTADWQPLPTAGAPGARTLHSAVWTGSEMIIWGGKVTGSPSEVGDGARYVPASDSWTPVSSAGAPSPRHSHSAVWTGDRMIIWGGFGDFDYRQDGAQYDPATDSWTPISNSGVPQGRTLHRTVWSGSEMMIWGGLNGTSPLGNGARYNPALDQWSPIAQPNAPSARFSHHAAWTGSEMVVWGGTDTFDWLDNGAYYDPASNSWTGTVSSNNAPIIRESGTGLFTREGFMVWGGWDGGNYLNDGATLTPGSDWTVINMQNNPTSRSKHASVWTGEQVIVWGGCSGEVCDVYRSDGALFTPSARGGVWVPIASEEVLSGRIEHSMVWTGDEAIVFGGRGGAGILGGGARTALQPQQ